MALHHHPPSMCCARRQGVPEGRSKSAQANVKSCQLYAGTLPGIVKQVAAFGSACQFGPGYVLYTHLPAQPEHLQQHPPCEHSRELPLHRSGARLPKSTPHGAHTLTAHMQGSSSWAGVAGKELDERERSAVL